jgi:UPF0716 protein FxsA
MHSPVRAILLLIFIDIPLVEIALLIKIGQVIGFWATIALIIATAAIGTWLLHAQGLQTLRRVMSSLDEGRPPITAVLEGFLLLVAGLLLLTPGILTDTLGFILLVPPVRALIVRYGLNRIFVVTVAGQSWRTESRGDEDDLRGAWTGPEEPPARAEPGVRRSPDKDGPVIEGEYERLEERTVDPRRRRH